jgi:hypothetical protein
MSADFRALTPPPTCPRCGSEALAEIWGVWNGCGDPWHWPDEDEQARRNLDHLKREMDVKHVPLGDNEKEGT